MGDAFSEIGVSGSKGFEAWGVRDGGERWDVRVESFKGREQPQKLKWNPNFPGST